MWPTLLTGLLFASVAGWIYTALLLNRRIGVLERSKEEIQVEETLVFDFLHGLGEAFSETIRSHDLHRLIVVGATRVLDAPGGAGSLVVSALLYGKQNMGVLALANSPAGTPFSQSDFVVFKSIAEQSAFALYNAIVYSEANEKKRLDHDLEIARDIQRILLPAEAPAVNGFEISGINVPARQVSGDYFDYIKVD